MGAERAPHAHNRGTSTLFDRSLLEVRGAEEARALRALAANLVLAALASAGTIRVTLPNSLLVRRMLL